MAAAPTMPKTRAGDFTQARAIRWVLTAAILTGVIYAFRRAIEPSVSNAPAKGGKLGAVLGAGSPPPPLATWAVAYSTGFILLGLLTEPAPELAGSLAMLMVTGSLLTNGSAIAADINNLEGGHATGSAGVTVGPTARAPVSAPAIQTALAGVPPSAFNRPAGPPNLFAPVLPYGGPFGTGNILAGTTADPQP